jgi:hypothetical protein
VLLRSSGRLWAAVAGALLVVAYIGALAWALQTQSYNIWGSMLLVPALVAVNIPLLVAAGRRESDSWFARLILYAFGLKLVGSAARYAVAYLLYDGYADALGYSRFASAWHEMWRAGMVVWEVPDDGVTGTAFIRLVTTALYTVIGPSAIGGFLVFACFAFWGTYFMYRAFRIAVPEGDHRRYALLLFLLPSVLYWPSSIGKEAWLMFWIGMVALGAAKFYARQRGASILLAAGLDGDRHGAAALRGPARRRARARPAAPTSRGTGDRHPAQGGWCGADGRGRLDCRWALGRVPGHRRTVVRERADRDRHGIQEHRAGRIGVRAGAPHLTGGATGVVRHRALPALSVGGAQPPGDDVSAGRARAPGAVRLSWRRLRRLPGLLRSHPYLIFSLGYVCSSCGPSQDSATSGSSPGSACWCSVPLVFAALAQGAARVDDGSGKRQETEGAHA